MLSRFRLFFNEIEYFTYLNLWLVSLSLLLVIFFLLLSSSLLTIVSIYLNAAWMEFFLTLFSLWFLWLIISPSLIILLEFDLILIPSFIILMDLLIIYAAKIFMDRMVRCAIPMLLLYYGILAMFFSLVGIRFSKYRVNIIVIQTVIKVYLSYWIILFNFLASFLFINLFIPI